MAGDYVHMIPIQDLFNKIRWDKEFGKGYFEIGYEDHWEEKIIRIAFKKIVFEEGNHFSFQIKLEWRNGNDSIPSS